jgi:hypothetical protein
MEFIKNSGSIFTRHDVVLVRTRALMSAPTCYVRKSQSGSMCGLKREMTVQSALDNSVKVIVFTSIIVWFFAGPHPTLLIWFKTRKYTINEDTSQNFSF